MARKLKLASNSKTPVDISEQIARRAYEIYEARGCEHGRDVQDWLNAEAEITGNTTMPGVLKQSAS